MEQNLITLLSVQYDNENDKYNIQIPAGSNVAETAFCMAVVIKCLIRDNVIKDANVVTDMINKYCNDPQYSEIKEKSDEQQ